MHVPVNDLRAKSKTDLHDSRQQIDVKSEFVARRANFVLCMPGQRRGAPHVNSRHVGALVVGHHGHLMP
jgi:hypothetical protein